MWLIKYFDKIKRMDSLIARKATGNPNEFSEKLHLSKRSLMSYLQAMKSLGFPVKFDKERSTYFYEQNWKVSDIMLRLIDKEEQKKINMELSSEDKEKCAEALHQNNDEKINAYCRDLFI